MISSIAWRWPQKTTVSMRMHLPVEERTECSGTYDVSRAPARAPPRPDGCNPVLRAEAPLWFLASESKWRRTVQTAPRARAPVVCPCKFPCCKYLEASVAPAEPTFKVFGFTLLDDFANGSGGFSKPFGRGRTVRFVTGHWRLFDSGDTLVPKELAPATRFQPVTEVEGAVRW